MGSSADPEMTNPIDSSCRCWSKRKPNSIAIAMARNASSSTISRAWREATASADDAKSARCASIAERLACDQYKRSDPLPSLRSSAIARAISMRTAASPESSASCVANASSARDAPSSVLVMDASESSSWRGVTV